MTLVLKRHLDILGISHLDSNQTNEIFLKDILLEPSCSFEGDVTTG